MFECVFTYIWMQKVTGNNIVCQSPTCSSKESHAPEDQDAGRWVHPCVWGWEITTLECPSTVPPGTQQPASRQSLKHSSSFQPVMLSLKFELVWYVTSRDKWWGCGDCVPETNCLFQSLVFSSDSSIRRMRVHGPPWRTAVQACT